MYSDMYREKRRRRQVVFVVVAQIASSGSALLLGFDLTVVVGEATLQKCESKSSDSARISLEVKFYHNYH